MLVHKWTHSRGECTGGDGDYSYSYRYHIFRDDFDVLQFEVGVYEKREAEDPVSIIIDPTNPLNVKVEIRSFYDNKIYITHNAGNIWI